MRFVSPIRKSPSFFVALMIFYIPVFSQSEDPRVREEPEEAMYGIIFLVVVGIILGLIRAIRKERHPTGRF